MLQGLAVRQHGLATRQQLLDLGFTSREITGRAARGVLGARRTSRVRRGRRVVRPAPGLACGDVVLCRLGLARKRRGPPRLRRPSSIAAVGGDRRSAPNRLPRRRCPPVSQPDATRTHHRGRHPLHIGGQDVARPRAPRHPRGARRRVRARHRGGPHHAATRRPLPRTTDGRSSRGRCVACRRRNPPRPWCCHPEPARGDREPGRHRGAAAEAGASAPGRDRSARVPSRPRMARCAHVRRGRRFRLPPHTKTVPAATANARTCSSSPDGNRCATPGPWRATTPIASSRRYARCSTIGGDGLPDRATACQPAPSLPEGFVTSGVETLLKSDGRGRRGGRAEGSRESRGTSGGRPASDGLFASHVVRSSPRRTKRRGP